VRLYTQAAIMQPTLSKWWYRIGKLNWQRASPESQSCFQQENIGTFKKGYDIPVQIYSIGVIPQSIQLEVQVTLGNLY